MFKHAYVLANAENENRRLYSSNLFYIILVDTARADADVQRAMCMTFGVF